MTVLYSKYESKKSSASEKCEIKQSLKVMGNEKKGGVKVVSIDRSCFSELSILIFISF